MKTTDAFTTQILCKAAIRWAQVCQRMNREMKVMTIPSSEVLTTVTVTSANQDPDVCSE